MTPSSRNQMKSCSNLSGKVRVIARIRGFRDHELASKSVIQVCKSSGSGPSEKVTLSFDDQTSSRKNEYEVDHCYHQNEDTALIFSMEIKPHISKVFDGESSTFIAFGARGTGKTYTIQGSKENVGLGMMVMDEILKMVEGGKHAVAVSIYEVFQDHVYDILDSKNPEVPVKSMLEFQNLYCMGSTSNKPKQKIAPELPRRSHKALMIHILACDKGGNPKCVGKMNFVDLADTIHAVTLASRLKSIKPSMTAKKQTNSSVPLSANKADSVVAARSAAKKGTNSRLPMSGKKTNAVLKERRNIFGDTDAEQANGFKKQANKPSNLVKSDIPNGDSAVVKEEKGSSDGALYSDVIDVASAIVPCDNIVKEDNNLLVNEGQSPPLSVRLKELSMNLQSLCSTPLPTSTPQVANTEIGNIIDAVEPKTPIVTHKMDFSNCPSGTFSKRSSGMKQSLVQDYLEFLNTASKEDLKGIWGIGEKRASYICELREESPQPFKNVKRMMKKVAGELFSN
ncbi:Kinesin, motor domain-containing protein [Cynara cardunculus var. scolymus]|uniref:Kinesin, motor domain-containing protein n=1 Tax=Cynara cardunculus var. scolymus TaxID=59895 RepID=A0A118K647_CYNCS|nr:Kinesin, motor domain-containing protein [Cynara cardunculus var. scolymus]